MLIVAITIAGCKEADSTVEYSSRVEINSSRIETKTQEFCREDPQAIQVNLLNSLLNQGWVYRGPINNNGINCLNILFERTVDQ